MADEKQKPKVGRNETDDAPAPDVFSREEHLANAEGMYGVPSHIVAGAFAVIDEAAKGDTKDGFTKSDVEDAIARFQSRDITKEH